MTRTKLSITQLKGLPALIDLLFGTILGLRRSNT
jgi:hypothetical protein